MFRRKCVKEGRKKEGEEEGDKRSRFMFGGLGDGDFPLRILQHEDDVKQVRES